MAELYGYVGKILKVDLTAGKTSEIDTSKYVPTFIGGRGINAKIGWDEIPPGTGPFDPENRLMLMTGPLTGTLVPGSGRLTVSGVGAQPYRSGGRFTNSGLGGHWPGELKYAGYDGVVVYGKADKPVYLWIHDRKAEIRDASGLWGLDTYSTQLKIANELGEEIRVAVIGPAGENLIRWSVIMTETESAAGQGGFGAVMGSKNLKAIAVRGTGGVKIAKPKEFWDLYLDPWRWEECWAVGPHEVPAVRRKVRSPLKAKPSRESRIHACSMACTGACGATYYKKIPSKLGRGFYSTQEHCVGPTSETHDGDIEVRTLSSMYGLNQWEFFLGTIAWLNFCKDAGLISEIDGVSIPGAGGDAVKSLYAPDKLWDVVMRKATYREGELGKALAEGTCRAADMLFNGKGKGLLNQIYPGAPESPLGFPGHWCGHWSPPGSNPVPYPWWLTSALIWATASRDPANDSVHHYTDNMTFYPAKTDEYPEYAGFVTWEQAKAIGKKIYGIEAAMDVKVDYEPPEGRVVPAIWHQNRGMVLSSLLMCDWQMPRIFSVYSADCYGDTSIESKCFSTVTGVNWTEAELDKAGERAYTVERAIDIRNYGRTRKEDELVIPYFELPDRYTPPPRGPIGVNRAKFLKLMDRYYELRGWDKATGWPTRAKLEELGLKDVADELAKLGKLP